MNPLAELAIPLETILTLVFYLTVAAYTIFTFIMYYHWNEYSLDNTVTKITLVFYLLSTVPLIVALGILTFFIL